MKTKILVLLTVFIDVIGFGIVIPIMPFYVKNFSASPLTVTTLFAIYGLCSFFSAPWIGALSDRHGRRPALIISIASTALGWFIFAIANSIWMLYLGRIIDGIANGNMPVAQSALVDLAKDDKERTANLGLIGAIFGIGFIIGPLLGATLWHLSPTLPFWFVGCLATANVIAAYLFLPETLKKEINISQKNISLNPFSPITSAIKNSALRPNYVALLLFGVAITGTQSVFSLYLNHVFGYQELAIGAIFGAMGIVIALNQAIIMRKFWLKRFKEPTLELIMLIIFGLGYLIIAIPSTATLIIGLLGITFGQSVLRVVMNGQILAKSPPAMRGEVLGISASIISLTAGIAPFIAGALFNWHYPAPFIFGASVLFLAFIVLYHTKQPAITQPPENIPIISEV